MMAEITNPSRIRRVLRAADSALTGNVSATSVRREIAEILDALDGNGYLVIRKESAGPCTFSAIYPTEEAAEQAIASDLPEWPGLDRADYDIVPAEYQF